MEVQKYLENLLKANSGVYISEKDYSLYNITQFYNRISLVVGCSRVGVPNLPVLCISPENFEDVFGKHDYHLERRNSYFHRTVKDMLGEGPVIALNLMLHDNDLDKYNWVNISTSSDKWNSKTRSNSIQDFYNTATGFWQRSTDNFIDIVKENTSEWKNNPLNFVNQKDKPVSILIFKSEIGGFDIPVEDWYNGKYPEYLHPKDYISDYMVQVIAVEGKWDNYKELANSTLWNKYFDLTGIKKDKVDEFLNNPSVNLLHRWNCSLIPYFRDKQGNDMWIQSVINREINETGIMCAVDNDIIESESRNGIIDVLGDNLTKNKNPQIDFLSYKRYMTDFYILEETLLDSPKNAFGNHLFNFKGRTQIYSEGYVDGVSLKPIIVSTTTSIEVKPFDAQEGAYGVINGKVIDINSNISDILALHNILVPNAHRAYLILLTDTGIKFKLGDITPLEQNLFLPQIDYKKEIVLGYYELIQDDNMNYITNFFPVTLDDSGYINPFRQGNENISKIKFNPTQYNWLQEIYFEDIYNPKPQDYNQMRLYHLWHWLSQNLQQDKSLIIDNNGNKQPVNWIEQGNDKSGRYIKIAIKDKNSNIDAGTQGMISYYMQDIEFLSKNEKWDYNKPPLYFGTKGIIGYESFIKDSYLKGFINSGDPFFWAFAEENNVSFLYDADINQNIILIPDGFSSNNYNNKKVVVEGTKYNDGIFNLLATTTYRNIPAIIVQEEVAFEENVEYVSFYDADFPYIINLYDKSGYTTALVEVWDGNPEELYKRLKKDKDPNSVWAKTLEIIKVQKDNEIIVDWNRYAKSLEKGYFLLSNRVAVTDDKNEVIRNWTRIVDLQRISDTQLLVTTDSPIRWRMVDDVLETDILRPIWEWVNTLDFKVLDGFKPREEVFPDGTDEKMNQILNLIAEGTKMQSSLTTERFEWRYLIDSFGGGLHENSKTQLTQLCAKKQFALGFINVPSIKQMKKDGTKFTTDNKFDTKKFISGGDKKNNQGSGYSLASLGSTHAVYLAPWVSVFENGRFQIVPPASHVGQLFMKKHNDNKLKIWDALAGIDRSKIYTINGLEERMSESELNDLHNFGITTLTNYNTVFNDAIFYIFNEKTAVSENSVLRFTHNREALIELELSMHKALRNLQWNFIIKENNKTKLEVEKLANSICEYYRLNNAIQSYTNEFIIDNELIDAQIGLLNTQVELSGVMQTILLRMSILKTGQISITFG